jgi:ATP-dependent Zn protease
MDGINSNASVIVIAGTNRVDVLDPALIRPGTVSSELSIAQKMYKNKTGLIIVSF